ncbi:MAG: hypothetical protein OHK0019_28930 [Saprospiraceae bacterium]
MKYSLLIAVLLCLNGILSAQPVIPPPTQTDEIIIDNVTPGKADANDRIRYKVTISNTGTAPATGTQLNVAPDVKTTFVPGSFRTSPLAFDDSYTCLGNVGITVPAANGLRANDFDDNLAGLTITAVTNAATAQGGSITIAADGGFSYNPPRGFEGTDTYVYTLNDGNDADGAGPIPGTNTGTVSITVSGMIWFINNNAGACASSCDGRMSNPYTSLSAFNTANALAGGLNPDNNDNIFVYESTTAYTSGIVLRDGQKLIGQDATVTLLAATGLSQPTYGNTLPATNSGNGTLATIANAAGDGVTLGVSNTLRGFTVGNCSDFGIENGGTNSVGVLVVSEVTINNTTGGGFDASHSSSTGMNVVFTALSSTGGVNGVNLNNCVGTFTINGGTITNPTGTGVLIVGGSVAFSSSGAITDNSGFAVDVDNHDSGNVTFSGSITSTGTGIRVQNCGGGLKLFSGTKSLNTGANTAITLSSNTAATINFTGGGLTITTTSGTGFSATGGGTVSVQGSGNTINSSSGIALNVVNTTIGASGMNFQSISSGNNTAAPDPANGIVLNNTGSSGGLTVAGTGSSGTGGTIQNTTSDGVYLNQTINPSLSYMNINDAADNGIFVDAVSGLSLSNLFMDSNGAQSEGGAIQDCGIHIEDLIGTSNTISNSTIQDSRNTNLDWNPNSSSSMSTLTVTNTNLNHAGEGVSSQGNAGINLVATGTANVKLVVISGQIKNNAAAGILATGSSGTTVYTDIDGVDMISSAPPAPVLTGACDPQPGNYGNGVGTNFGINLTSTGTSNQRHRVNNVQIAYTGIAPCDGGLGSAIGFIPSGTGTFDITITNNTIGLVGAPRSGNENVFGIAGDVQGSGTVRMNVSNNTVRNTALNGIYIQTRDPDALTGHVTASLTLRDNVVGPISDVDTDDFPFGGGPGGPVETIATRLDSRNDSDLCLDIKTNTSTGLSGNEGFHVRQRDTSVFRLERAIASDVASTSAVASFIIAQNNPPAGQTARAQQATGFTIAADGACPTPLLP